ncbi:hypothetical protein [Legionella sp. CNM-4043-24]|uniref:hypothetical protein n=1 Tax=Legionella sp. CNM-4043-24 TaxID=3421646 RepID=UPI00403B0BD5
MRCYVLLRRMNHEDMDERGMNTNPIEWAIPAGHRDLITMFVNNYIGSIKQSMAEFIDHLEPGRYHHAEREGYHLYARTLGHHCFGIATDTELTGKQLNHLCRYLLIDELPMQTVADDVIGHTVNREIEAIKRELAETTDIMKSNLQKMELRGALLKELEEGTRMLEQEAIIFHHEARELNRCWPDFCGRWFTLPSLSWPFK